MDHFYEGVQTSPEYVIRKTEIDGTAARAPSYAAEADDISIFTREKIEQVDLEAGEDSDKARGRAFRNVLIAVTAVILLVVVPLVTGTIFYQKAVYYENREKYINRQNEMSARVINEMRNKIENELSEENIKIAYKAVYGVDPPEIMRSSEIIFAETQNRVMYP